MRERYLCMLQLQEQLMQLFNLCGVKADPMQVTPLPVPLQWLERLVQDNQLYNYLENLTEMTEKAIKELRILKLEVWNSQENERVMDDLYRQLQQQEAQLSQAAGVQQQLKDENIQLRKLLHQEQLQTVKSIITLRDNLLMKKDWLESTMPEEATAAKFIHSQLQETAKLLADMGVEILEDTGAFDSRCHTAVQTRPTEDPALIDQIAETFRPGYRFRGETLRSQEVIIYTKA